MSLNSLHEPVRLNNGIFMPRLGLGVWQIPEGRETVQAVTMALTTGYRHIDTAAIYGNESSVGQAVRECGIPRNELFITTKLWNTDHGYTQALRACETSLEKLGLEYVDLYLVHWPQNGQRLETWRAMETLVQQGKCRAVGVSNYTLRHVQELIGQADIMPAVNQVEFSPFLYQRELLEFCHAQYIQLEAYSPLTRGRKLDHPVVAQIAAAYAKTPAQILIRWSLQQGLVVIPKSSHPQRISENAQVFDFELTPEDMERLDALNENFRVAWDPSAIP